jgi:hypothetical protein
MPHDLRMLEDTSRLYVPRDQLARFPVGSVWENVTSFDGDYLQVTAVGEVGDQAWVEFVLVAEAPGDRDWRKLHKWGGNPLAPPRAS